MPSRKTKPMRFSELIKRAVNIEPHELRAALTSFCFVFLLMAAYYILRPVRDAMASDWTDAEVSWLWTFTFFFSALAVSLYGWVVTTVKFNRLVPSVYAFFALSFLGFYIATQSAAERVLIDKSFYVWISVFSLFHISVFWSFMADLFNRQQAPRLFGFIGAGASTGGLVGPSIPAFFVDSIGTNNLLLVAAVLLLLTVPIISFLQRLKVKELKNEAVQVDTADFEYVGGNPLSGFSEFLKSP